MGKTFASHPKAAYWSQKNTSDINKVKPHSHKKFWFDCDVCDHDFLSSPLVISRGSWCPYCANDKLCNDDNCNDCFSKSLASHDKAQYWIYEKNLLTPRQIILGSDKKYWFKCNECNHEILQNPAKIKSGAWCVYCVSLTFCENDCDFCFSKSLASDPRSKCFVR